MLLSRGASVVAYADLRALPADARGGMPFGVSVAVALNGEILNEIATGPTAAYWDEYNRVNALLDELAKAAIGFLTERGFRAVAAAASGRVDPETLTTRLPHKTVATRAGLGWIGKTALLITKRFGSGVRLTSILTDAPLPAGEPVDESQCGECRLCATACPAQASRDRLWTAGMERADIYDAFACRRTASELARKAGAGKSICGICISVCPWTRRYIDADERG